MHALSRRLNRLERDLPSADDVEQDDQAERARIEREHGLWLTLFSTMAPKHVEHVMGELLAIWRGAPGWNERSFPSALTSEASTLVSRRVQQEAFFPQRPLSLPSVVAQVYLDHPHAIGLQDCERCGQELPFVTGTSQPRTTPRRFFDACPVCGGHVGTNAHYYTMHGVIQRCQDCDGMQPSTPEQEHFLARHHRPRCSCRTPLRMTE